ncbi:MAG: sialate O-acetylesterase [Verrucomicrobiota bacterium]
MIDRLTSFRTLACTLLLGVLGSGIAHADVTLPTLFGDNMVLQQQTNNKVWGTADPGEAITVTFADQKHEAVADESGDWYVELDPVTGSNDPHELKISGNNELKFTNVLVGEVWLCSGQSNMQWSVAHSNDHDLTLLTQRSPNIRLIQVPLVGTQEPQSDFKGAWRAADDENLRWFSAVGFYFGQTLNDVLDVPVGLIMSSWGGSPAESWMAREVLEQNEIHDYLLQEWDQKAKEPYDVEAAELLFQEELAAWKTQVEEAEKNNRIPPSRPWKKPNPLEGQHRPSNCYNGMIKPLVGYGMRGCIWYQGESNTWKANHYDTTFAMLIESWRDEWGIGDFSFYWVNLADYATSDSWKGNHKWPYLREAQTKTLSLPNTGEAVTIDLGEANDIHPRDKEAVGRRLARIALAQDYGYKKLPYLNPKYESMSVSGNKITLKFVDVGQGLKTVDNDQPLGFTIAGKDKEFIPASANIVNRDTIEVWSDRVSKPVAVRYAWEDNPTCNVYSLERLPLTPFRTDNWAWPF